MNTKTCNRPARRPRPCPPARAFTLVELMVVIAIIGLLVALAIPALNAARTAAKVASTNATISALGTGTEMFHSDSAMGGAYPPSVLTAVAPNPHGSGEITVVGANLLVWALAGADLLGAPGFRDLDNGGAADDPFGGWTDNMSNNNIQFGLYTIDSSTRKPVHPRSGPYVDLSKVNLTKQAGSQFQVPAQTSGPTLQSHAFLDAWDQPILYYRANPNAPRMVDAGRGGSEGYNVVNNRYSPTGTYNLYDNAMITGFSGITGMDFGASAAHFSPNLALNPELGDPLNPGSPRQTFAFHLWNQSVTAVPTAHRADSFILLSAGPDGRFGTADDVANYPINK